MKRIRSLSLFGLILLGLLHTGALQVLPGAVRFVLSMTLLVWYPGYLLLGRLRGANSYPALFTLPFSLLLGISAHAVVAGIFSLTGAGFGAWSVVARWLVALALALEFIRPVARPAWPYGRAVAALFIALALAAMLQGDGIGFNEDAYDHIGYMGRILQDGELFPRGVLAAGESAAGLDLPDPRKGTLHPLLALVCSLSGATPLEAWRWLPPLMFPLTFMSFLWFCAAFVRGRGGVAWCGVMFLATWSGVGLLFADEAVYGQNLAVQWLWLITPLALDTHEGRVRGNLRLMLLAALGGPFVHAGVSLHLGIAAATLVAMPALAGIPRRQALGVGAVLIGAILPATLLRLSQTATPNLLHAHVQGVLYFSERWFVMSPIEVLRQHGLLFLGGLALLPLTLLLARGRPCARRQLAFAVIPVLISFVPLLATPLFERVTYMAFRSLLNIPVFPVIVVSVAALVSAAWRRGLVTRAGVAVFLAIWSFVFVTPGLRSAFAALTTHERKGSFVADATGLVDFLHTLAPNSVIASDPKTSYALSAVTPHRFVAVHGQHATPYDALAMERLSAVRDILSPFAVVSDVLRACERFKVDYVVVNGRSGTRSSEYLSMWDAGFAPAVVPRLEGMSGRFQKVYGDATGGITVLMHEPAGRGTLYRGSPRPPVGAPFTGGECSLPVPGNRFRVTRLRVEPSSTIPGDSIHVSVGLLREDATPPGLPLVMHLRIDHSSVPTQRRYPGEKLVRRAQERFAGRFVRFRYDRAFMGDHYPVDYWPVGREISDRFSLAVPRVLALGSYRVEASVQEIPMLPNFTLGDLLFNRDHYSGRSCEQLEISDRAVKRP